ncbi:MAG: aromatic amino acid ammonia-lyase [Pseudomonadota bacterium]
MDTIELTGEGLSVEALEKVVAGARVSLSVEALRRMEAAHQVIRKAVDERRPVYGVTTGLGPRVTEALSEDEISAMALNTIRGRAHSAGPDLSFDAGRAALAVRINTLLIGGAGVRPALAEDLVAMLNAGLAPVMRQAGSTGAADLMWGGDFALGLIGEGRLFDDHGAVRPAGEVLSGAGLAPIVPGPREGLALVSHSSVTAGVAALGICALSRALAATERAAALSLTAFRANLSALDPALLALRPQAGQLEAAKAISALLEGSDLWSPGSARRLQDPLSLRNIPQTHGAFYAALAAAREAVEQEMNAASDNPGVLVDRGEVASHGGYLTPHLTLVLSNLAQAVAQITAMQQARIGKLMFERFTGLPNGLTDAGAGGAGLAPVTKTAEALWAEIAHKAAPPPIYPSFSADGVEDISCLAPLSALALEPLAQSWARLTAIELMTATQAAGLRGAPIPSPLVPVMQSVRNASPLVTSDRPLGDGIEAIAQSILSPGPI